MENYVQNPYYPYIESADVALTILKKDYESLKASVSSPAILAFVKEQCEIHEVPQNEDAITLIWKDESWTDQFVEPGFVMGFLKGEDRPFHLVIVGYDHPSHVEITCNKIGDDMLPDEEYIGFDHVPKVKREFVF